MRVAVRRPNEAIFVKPYGVVGQVEPVLCNIRDTASVKAAMAGADAVVNCVGILAESGKNRFDAVQAEGAERVAALAAASRRTATGAYLGHRAEHGRGERICRDQGCRARRRCSSICLMR